MKISDLSVSNSNYVPSSMHKGLSITKNGNILNSNFNNNKFLNISQKNLNNKNMESDDNFSIFEEKNLNNEENKVQNNKNINLNHGNDEDKKNNNNNTNKELEEKINKLVLKLKTQLNFNYTGKRTIGLKNTENKDCSYVNSLLQCLGGLPDLLLYLQKNISYINNPAKLPFTFCFFREIEKLYINKSLENSTKHNASTFITVIEHFYPFLIINRNPIDLFNILMHDLHIELNKASLKSQKTIFPKDFEKKNLNEVIKKSKINFSDKNNSIISQIFTYFFIKEIKCTKCNNTFYELQNFTSFDLDLINTYKTYKKNNLTINDCLTYYISPSKINVICSLCNKSSKLVIKKNFYSLSNNLVFLINRNNQNDEQEIMKIKLNYEEYLDISYYIDSKFNDRKAEYILIGVVAFLFKENKFTAFCKNLFYNEWICFDDELIEECNYSYMMNNSTPYILFYKLLE